MPRQERTKSGTGIYHVMLGMKNNGTFGTIDDLDISYDGNQLVKVTDAAEALNYSDALDFHDGDDTACEYDYDSNGALTRDNNRGINGITYDYGHHPNYINMNMTSGPRNITNDYTPDGRKLLSKHVMSIPKVNGYTKKTTTDLYIDGLMLRGDTTLLWRFDGGYVDLNANGTPTRWNYYIADHLGSTRMVVDSNDSIRETINYYPFGSEMRMEAPAQMTNNLGHPFRFTGKELDRQNSLNMYDFGARMYDVAGVPMWTSIDPLAEKYYNVTPYSYCAGDPVNRFDPDGKDSFLFTWLPKGDAVGHSAIGIQERNQSGVPTSNVIVRHLWPLGGSVSLGETKEADYRKEIISESKLSEFKGGEEGGADGILKIPGNAAQDKKMSTALDNYEADNPNYKLGENDCANYTKSAVKSIGIEGEINSKVQLVNPSNNRVYLEKKFTTPAGVHNLVKGSKNVITIKKLPVMNGNPNFQFRYEEPSGISRIMLEKRINKL